MQYKKSKKVDFAGRFLELMEASGKTQKELASIFNVSESSLINWKRGQLPKSEELYQIARCFGVSMEWLLTGSDADADGDNLWKSKARAAEHLLGEVRSSLATILKKI
ncbi:MAG: helix-turn-helix transcriptional regulator [Verrucomicrobiales bacterium]|jgi:transcriptional regulator with XRE-family HTH domain|nr:helix-turn-helix transcriptional regulator [Verrucomicrobiales bacterium]